MPRTGPDRTLADEMGALLDLWERGDGLSAPRRGLLLLGAALPGQGEQALARLPIGGRDAALLDLGDRLFGNRISCLLPCDGCGERIEIDFLSDEVRAPAATSGQMVEARFGGAAIRARLPDSTDLMAIQGESDPARAERRLLERCLAPPGAAAGLLPEEAIAAFGEAMSAADPQAEIVLDLACPACTLAASAPFDIVGYLWGRLDHWARAMLAAIDAISGRYGWSEAAVLGLSARRRQTYLDLIAGTER